MLGLSVVAVGAREDGPDVFLGVVLILIGSLIHSAIYIMSECLLVFCSHPISPELLCTLLGTMGGGVNIFWQLVYTAPRYQSLVVDEIASHQGSLSVIVVAYILLAFAGLGHGLCFFNLLSILGSTSTGLIKGVQSVAIFVASHFAFCAVQQSQCFSMLKGVSLLIVLIGVYLYTLYQPAHSTDYRDASGSMKLAHSSLRLNAYLSIYDRIPGDADDNIIDSATQSEYVSFAELQTTLKEMQKGDGVELLPGGGRRGVSGRLSSSSTAGDKYNRNSLSAEPWPHDEVERVDVISSYQHSEGII
eukprot:gene23251-29456_t